MIKVTRWLDSCKVRQMCIRYRYYTCGDCASYDKMLFKAGGLDADNLEAVLEIAEDIYWHSTMKNDTEYPKRDCLEGIVNMLLSECVDMFVDIDRKGV